MSWVFPGNQQEEKPTLTFYQAPFFRVTKLLLWSQKNKQFGIEIINAIVYHCFTGKIV